MTHTPLKKIRHKKSRKQIATHTYPPQKKARFQKKLRALFIVFLQV